MHTHAVYRLYNTHNDVTLSHLPAGEENSGCDLFHGQVADVTQGPPTCRAAV